MLFKFVIVAFSIARVLGMDEWRKLALGERRKAPTEGVAGLNIFVRDRMDVVVPVEVHSGATVQDLQVAAQSVDVALQG